MFCPRCGRELPEAGDCPSCGQPRPDLTPDRPASARGPLRAIGCGLGGVTLGILAGIGIGFLICVGMVSSFVQDIGRAIGIK